MGVQRMGGRTAVVDVRAEEAARVASPGVAEVWADLSGMSFGEVPAMGLAAGERPAADVEVLCSAVAVAEFELARRMVAAARSGSLPLVGEAAMLLARGWSSGWARRLARSGEFVGVHPTLGDAWAAGVITSEHVHALARQADRLSEAEMAAVIVELTPLWGQLSPQAVGAFVARVIRVLHPPDDPEPDETAAHESRSLSFALTSDAVVLSGCLPRVEGEAVIAAIDAFAERLRSEADHVPASARRADGLVALVNAAHASGSIPNRGGLPVSVSVTVSTTAMGDEDWSTSRGHTLTQGEKRFAACDALLTPILVESDECPDTVEELLQAAGQPAVRLGESGSAAAGRRLASPRWQRLCSAPGSHWRSGARPGSPPRPNGAHWRREIAAASSPAAESRLRHARRTTWSIGRREEVPRSPTWRCCAGPITARSTCACGASPQRPGNRLPSQDPERRRARRGRATTDRHGSSPARRAPDGGCELAVGVDTRGGIYSGQCPKTQGA